MQTDGSMVPALEKLLLGRHLHHILTGSLNIYKVALLPGPAVDVEMMTVD